MSVAYAESSAKGVLLTAIFNYIQLCTFGVSSSSNGHTLVKG